MQSCHVTKWETNSILILSKWGEDIGRNINYIVHVSILHLDMLSKTTKYLFNTT